MQRRCRSIFLFSAPTIFGELFSFIGIFAACSKIVMASECRRNRVRETQSKDIGVFRRPAAAAEPASMHTIRCTSAPTSMCQRVLYSSFVLLAMYVWEAAATYVKLYGILAYKTNKHQSECNFFIVFICSSGEAIGVALVVVLSIPPKTCCWWCWWVCKCNISCWRTHSRVHTYNGNIATTIWRKWCRSVA